MSVLTWKTQHLVVHHGSSGRARYIHIVSGNGHPQLAVAAIQSMQANDWNVSELASLESLLEGNPLIEQVRARTRERLLSELPESGRRLIERLSLKIGSFRRSFVLDMAQIAPTVPDGGIVFEKLIGSWVDQQERDRFALSPLLSNYAVNTLTDEHKQKINFEIANSLIKGQTLSPVEANSALIAALSGKNTQVISHICIAVLMAVQDDLEMIAPHLMILTLMRTDISAYEKPNISQMIRGAQLLLVCHEETEKEKAIEILECFRAESQRVELELLRISMVCLVYVKILMTETKFGAFPNYWNLVEQVDNLLEKLPLGLLEDTIVKGMDGVSVVGLMFANQTRQMRKIDELVDVFRFLDLCGQELRQKLLKFYSNPAVRMDMLVSGAWLSEHDANTINPSSHSKTFAQLEAFANNWGYTDLAVCCRKYRAIIIDEYGNNKKQALAVLEEGLKLYGQTDSELMRAKAKVLYRAKDHQGSLDLSKKLIDGDAPLSKTEKAFLGRDAAISAEDQCDYETARRYFLYGSNAAAECNIPDMLPMKVGLMADAALASWRAGDHETCLRDFISILREIDAIDPKNSLRAAHCHAVCRHVLLWLYEDITGEKGLLSDGQVTKIYSGIVSNPEPNPAIGDHFITPIEMAWYMLAAIESSVFIDVGITQNLEAFLPKGPVFEGQVLLTSSRRRKAFLLLDLKLFITAIRETVTQWAYINERGGFEKSFDLKNVTYITLPNPTLEHQINHSVFTEQHVLCFLSNCIFAGNITNIDQITSALNEGQEVKVREEFLSCLHGSGSGTDYNTSLAALLATHKRAIVKNSTVSPLQVFELAFETLQLAKQTDCIQLMAKPIFDWMVKKWDFILENQRFLLKHPALHEKHINEVRAMKVKLEVNDVIDLLQAMLPAVGPSNQSQIGHLLNLLRM